MSGQKIITLEAAAKYVGVSRQALYRWPKAYKIGRQIDGIWHFDAEELDRIVAAKKLLGQALK
jgi:predicted site-specific integrase-resolvase